MTNSKQKRIKNNPKTPYTLRLSEKEYKDWNDFAKANGLNTKSKLIKKAVSVVMQNPSLLNPLTDEDYKLSEMREIIGEKLELQETKTKEYNKERDDRLLLIEQKIDILLKHKSFDVKKVEKSLENEHLEAIFDD